MKVRGCAMECTLVAIAPVFAHKNAIISKNPLFDVMECCTVTVAAV